MGNKFSRFHILNYASDLADVYISQFKRATLQNYFHLVNSLDAKLHLEKRRLMSHRNIKSPGPLSIKSLSLAQKDANQRQAHFSVFRGPSLWKPSVLPDRLEDVLNQDFDSVLSGNKLLRKVAKCSVNVFPRYFVLWCLQTRKISSHFKHTANRLSLF